MVQYATTPGQFAQLFDKQADAYAKFRPTYPPALFEAILDFHRASRAPACKLAADIATGSGQAAMGMAAHVDRIIAIDANQQQLNAVSTTTLPPNIEFRQGVAEATGLSPASVDIGICAQALHWCVTEPAPEKHLNTRHRFDLDSFYVEMGRILRPQGTLAAWTYDIPHFGVPDADAALQRWYKGVLGPYWSARRALVDNHYHGVLMACLSCKRVHRGQLYTRITGLEPKLGAVFERVQRWELAVPSEVTLDALINYFQTWSAFQEQKRVVGEDEALAAVGVLREELRAVLGERVQYRLPLYMMLCRRA